MSKDIQNHTMEEKENNHIETDEKEIDLLALIQKLWSSRKVLLNVVIIAFIAGLIVAFSIPKEYSTTIKLAPELEKSTSSRSLSALANLAGLTSGISATSDAVNPTLYPDVVQSVPFIVDLFDVPVTDKKGQLNTTLYDYIENNTSSPWWSVVLSLPGKAIGGIMSIFPSENQNDAKETDPFKLTKEENKVRLALEKRIGVIVDTKTAVIEISVLMQDPLISAMVADTVAANLKTYVTNYRTNKARQDLEYATKLNEEAKEEYFQAQQAYADYVDRNHGIAFNSRKVEETRLQNDVQLKYNLYDQTAQRVQMAKAKVQENTPVYAVLQPATVPLRASQPRKMTIIFSFVFLGFVSAAAWILFGQDLVVQFNKKDNG